MAVQEDIKRGSAPPGPEDAEAEPKADERPLPSAAAAETEIVEAVSAELESPETAAPTQLGTRRYVYAGYFVGAIGIAFLVSKVLGAAWLKLQGYAPSLGEPRDDVIMALSALIGGGAALYYWYRTRARQLAEEVAAEMSKVTWPSRTEVTNGTVVVIVTTIASTLFFALMDKFWGFLTNLVYGGS